MGQKVIFTGINFGMTIYPKNKILMIVTFLSLTQNIVTHPMEVQILGS